ncbi:MAG: hypothetical protein ACYCWW_07210, partial [Deltaproteobacteria bacterium]
RSSPALTAMNCARLLGCSLDGRHWLLHREVKGIDRTIPHKTLQNTVAKHGRIARVLRDEEERGNDHEANLQLGWRGLGCLLSCGLGWMVCRDRRRSEADLVLG